MASSSASLSSAPQYSFSPMTPASGGASLASQSSTAGDWDDIFDDQDDYGGEINTENVGSKDSIVFLIDCQSPMFRKHARTGEIPFHNAIKCAIATLTDKIISSENDLIGVILYGTKEKRNDGDFDGIYVVQSLDVPDAPRILDLEDLLKTESPVGSTDGSFPFNDALWACSAMFSSRSEKMATKRVFLFTNDDNPNVGNPGVRDQAKQRAKDFGELGIKIELFAISSPERRFDITKFYSDIIEVDEDDLTTRMNFDAAEKFEELRSSVRRKEFKKRALGRLPLRVGEMEIAVRLFNLVQECKKSSYTWLDSNNKNVKSTTKYICKDTAAVLMKEQIKFYYPYGGEKVQFTKDELAEIKKIDDPGIRLLGFKDRMALKDHYHIRSSSFIYPDDKVFVNIMIEENSSSEGKLVYPTESLALIQGSVTAFSALLDRMLALDKVAIARMTARKTSQPRFVALVPQREAFDEKGFQVMASGLAVVYLPYADDIRNPPVEGGPKANDEQRKAAKAIVKKLQIKFGSEEFQNPALQKYYAGLQAVALERPEIEEVDDLTLPDLDGMQRFNPILEKFAATCELDAADAAPSPKKRGRAVGGEARDAGGTRKRARAEPPAMSDEDYQNPARVNKLTVPKLKEYLKSKCVIIPAKAKKADLVEMVLDAAGG